MREKPAIIFDLDGTLADTAPDLIAALNHCLRPLNLPEIDRSTMNHLIGQGAMVMIQKALSHHNVSVTDEAVKGMHAEFLDHYERNIATHSKLFDGVLDTIENFKASGNAVCICTNKYEKLARRFLTEMRVTSLFDSITGGDTFAFRKPDGRHLVETARMAGAIPDASIMIGDSINDAQAAHDAGMKLVLVDFGYTDQSVTTMGADLIVSDFNGSAEKIMALAANNRG